MREVPLFDVKGIHPATGQVVMITIQADCARDAKLHAVACGLTMVTASVHDPEETDSLPDHGGRRASDCSQSDQTGRSRGQTSDAHADGDANTDGNPQAD